MRTIKRITMLFCILILFVNVGCEEIDKVIDCVECIKNQKVYYSTLENSGGVLSSAAVLVSRKNVIDSCNGNGEQESVLAAYSQGLEPDYNCD